MQMMERVIADWALRNDFVSSGDRCLRKMINGAAIRIEFKRASFVVISDVGGRTPKVVSKRFKDVTYDEANDAILGVDALAPR